ncbi:S1 family peptidase [Micromonospora inositola]|nr:S1 family peptidase [Micromonospora inositola]
MYRKRTLFAHAKKRCAVLATMALSIALGAVVNAAPSYAFSPSAPMDRESVQESLHYLTSTYGIDEAEGMRRLQLQSDGQELDRVLRKAEPQTYGGMLLDQAAGGVLVLSFTQPGAASSYVASMPDRQHVRVRQVRHPLSELDAISARLSKKVHAGPNAIFLPAVDEEGNQVVLGERTWVRDAKRAGTFAPRPSDVGTQPTTSSAERAAAVDEEVAIANAAAAAEGASVARRAMKLPHPLYTPYVDWGYCHPLYCKTTYGPMRGGLRLNIKRDNGTWGGCTSGFNVRSHGGAYNNWAWVLTAGHCVVGKANSTYIHHNGYNILTRNRNLEFNTFPYDYAILPYINGTYSQSWLDNFTGKNRILKYCRNGGQDSDADTPCGTQATSANQYITATHTLSEIKSGWVVCASGSGSDTANYPESYGSGAGAGYLVGTRCGKVIGKDWAINTDICARAGDSGGPLFSQIDSTGYGILEGSLQTRTGACYAGEQNNYIPLSTIFSDVNSPWISNGGSTFGIITSSTG